MAGCQLGQGLSMLAAYDMCVYRTKNTETKHKIDRQKVTKKHNA